MPECLTNIFNLQIYLRDLASIANKRLVSKEDYFSDTSESSSATVSTRFGSTASSRLLSSRSSNERVSAAISYPPTDRFRNSSNKSISQKNEEELRMAGKSDKDGNRESSKTPNRNEEDNSADNRIPDEFVTLTMVTRSTSPTPPASSSYVRSRRAEIGIVYQKEVTRLRKPPDSADEETQCDRMDETSRFSRYGGGNRISSVPWSAYLDKYSSGATSGTGSSSMYSRGFANTSSSSGRPNGFAYTRTNEASTIARNDIVAKETSDSSQDTHSSGNRSQNEKVYGDSNCARTDDENSTALDNSKTSSNGQSAHKTNEELKESKVQSNQHCSCGARKIDTSGNLHSSTRNSIQDPALRKEDSTMQDSRESKDSYDDCNQRRPFIPRLGCSSPKREIKIPKCASKTELASPKSETRCERRESTSKSGSDASFSSKVEEPLRIVEGHCQDQDETVPLCDVSQRKDSSSR